MVTLFGTSWSVACWDIHRLLEGMQVAYQFVDPERRARCCHHAPDFAHG